jgi:transcriptional regulator with GAF, ATPase, and Fis domain
MQKFAREMCKQIDAIPQDALQALAKWSWPGNVRELENFIERAVILTQGSSLRAPLAELRRDAAEASGDSTLEFVERAHLLRILGETGWVISKAAVRLGMPRTTLNAMMGKRGISRKDA